MKYGGVLVHHLEWKTKGLRPFALWSCYISAQHTAYILSFLRTNCFYNNTVPSDLEVFSIATGEARVYGVAQLV
jgi:hypothetical protein